MNRPQLDHERRIVWDREDALDFDYVRRGIAGTRTTEGPSPRTAGDRLVGWAVLSRHAPTSPAPSSVHYRRYWWLKDSDRPFDPDGVFADQAPSEAVDPRTVATGTMGKKTARVRGKTRGRRC